MTASSAVVVLTMPGFGIATLQHLATMPVWRDLDLRVAMVGPRPPPWRRIATWLRHEGRTRDDRLHPLGDRALSVGPAERWLRGTHVRWQWAESDSEVRHLRQQVKPGLTLTITSSVLFSARTLSEPAGTWFNLHPGLLPDYAGASPAPYMYLDAVGGCTIHEMTERVDAGAIVDLAPMSGELGADVGEYFFHRLPGHAAHRIAALIERWRRDEPIERLAMAPRPLRHCSKARLATDRQLNWRWPAARVERWVRALAALAPAWWVDMHGRRTEVMQARTLSGVPASSCGTVLHREGRWIEIACEDGAIALRCRHAFRAAAGDRLPLVTHAPSGAA